MPNRRALDASYIFLYVLTAMVASFVFLALSNLNSLGSLLDNSGQQAPTRLLIDVGGSVLERVTRFLDKLPFGATTVTFLFWLFIGILVYALILFIIDFGYSLKYQKSLIFDYRYPSYTKASSVIQRLFFDWILVLGAGLVLLFSLGFLAAFTIPVSRAVFMDVFYNPGSISAWLYSFEVVIILAFNSLIVLWLIRLFWRSRRELEAD
jgi:Zn-dependent protease with chaperone function